MVEGVAVQLARVPALQPVQGLPLPDRIPRPLERRDHAANRCRAAATVGRKPGARLLWARRTRTSRPPRPTTTLRAGRISLAGAGGRDGRRARTSWRRRACFRRRPRRAETIWSLGEYMTGAQRLAGVPACPASRPRPVGVFANQPSPFAGQRKRHLAVCLFLLLALSCWSRWRSHAFAAPATRCFSSSYGFTPRARGGSLVRHRRVRAERPHLERRALDSHRPRTTTGPISTSR